MNPKIVVIRDVECTLLENKEGILQIVPPFGPYTPVTAIYNPAIRHARSHALHALMKRATLEWTGIERFNV